LVFGLFPFPDATFSFAGRTFSIAGEAFSFAGEAFSFLSGLFHSPGSTFSFSGETFSFLFGLFPFSGVTLSFLSALFPFPGETFSCSGALAACDGILLTTWLTIEKSLVFEATDSITTGEKHEAPLPYGGYAERIVFVKMPSFTTRTRLSLKDPLVDLGMGDLFCGTTPRPDFSGLWGGDTCVKDILHEVYIDKNLIGTEAAAATTTPLNNVNNVGGPEYFYFYADRPFLYALVDRATKVPLFIDLLVN